MGVRSAPLVVPEGMVLPWWIPSPEVLEERERILKNQFFLVRIAGNGDVWRCTRCNSKHPYMTLMCIEQPFSGVDGGLYAFYKVAGDTGAVDFMNPTQRSRYESISRLFGRQPDLATSHPLLARSIQTGPRDIDAGAMALGLLEPITRAKAIQLARAINGRGIKPPFRLDGIP